MKTYKVTKNNEGTICWHNEEGLYHREDGPAVEWADGSKEWWVKGQRHREDGPAVEWADGSKEWYVNGILHRTDGPAHEKTNGDKSWWIEGKQLTEVEFNQYIKTIGDDKMNNNGHRINGKSTRIINFIVEQLLSIGECIATDHLAYELKENYKHRHVRDFINRVNQRLSFELNDSKKCKFSIITSGDVKAIHFKLISK